MNATSYNGWNNYETWLTALWIDNDSASYQQRLELCQQAKEEHPKDPDKQKQCLSILLECWIEEQAPETDQASLFTDLLNAALSEVDWQEIAESFLAE